LDLVLEVEVPEPAGALPLALGFADDKGASGSAVAALTGFVAAGFGGWAPATSGFARGFAGGGAVIAGCGGTE